MGRAGHTVAVKLIPGEPASGRATEVVAGSGELIGNTTPPGEQATWESSDEIRPHHDLQHNRRAAFPRTVGQPPHRALAHRPIGLFAGEQK